jgi:aminoglycoside phosphotransferase (APT) family kinase protein
MAALRRWLADAGSPLDTTGALTATLFPSGRSNVTYRLADDAGRSVVLRRPPLGNVMPTAHDMAREHRVLTGMARVGFPAPRPIALCEDEGVIGAPFLVMEYVEGSILATAADAAPLHPTDRDRASASLIATLAELHRVDPREAGLEGLGRPAGFLQRQATRWSQQWEITRTRELPSMDELGRRVSALVASVPNDVPSGLVHGDYRLDNVILSPAEWRAIAVLDWEMSTLGDPLADLALLLLYWSEPSDGLRHLIPIAENLTESPGFWDRARIIDAYVADTGHPLDHLDASTALACYKLAVIAESIHARAMSGKQLGTAATDRRGMGEATEALADMGLAVTVSGAVSGLAS